MTRRRRWLLGLLAVTFAIIGVVVAVPVVRVTVWGYLHNEPQYDSLPRAYWQHRLRTTGDLRSIYAVGQTAGEDESSALLLINLLKHSLDSPEAARAACNALATIEPLPPESVLTLCDALVSDSRSVRYAAYQALSNAECKRIARELLRLLNSDNPTTRARTALGAKGLMGVKSLEIQFAEETELQARLLALIQEDSVEVVVAAADALQRTSASRKAQLALVDAINRPDRDRRALVVALGGLTLTEGPALQLLIAEASRGLASDEAANALVRAGPWIEKAVVAALLAEITAGDLSETPLPGEGVRLRLGEVLRRINGKAVTQLRESLSNPEPRQRQRAAVALGYLQPVAASAIDDLLKALKDDDALVRASAARSLGLFSIHAKRLGPILSTLAKDDADERVRGQARKAARALAPGGK